MRTPSWRIVRYLFYTGGMAANYGRPKPIDPIWYRHGAMLRIRCACGRYEEHRVGACAERHRLSRDIRLDDLIRRLRCAQCDARPSAEVV